MPLCKPEPRDSSSWFWLSITSNRLFALQRHRFGGAFNWGTSDYRIIIRRNNYVIAESTRLEEIEKDWQFILQRACSQANVTDLNQLSEREEKELSAALIAVFLAIQQKTLAEISEPTPVISNSNEFLESNVYENEEEIGEGEEEYYEGEEEYYEGEQEIVEEMGNEYSQEGLVDRSYEEYLEPEEKLNTIPENNPPPAPYPKPLPKPPEYFQKQYGLANYGSMFTYTPFASNSFYRPSGEKMKPTSNVAPIEDTIDYDLDDSPPKSLSSQNPSGTASILEELDSLKPPPQSDPNNSKRMSSYNPNSSGGSMARRMSTHARPPLPLFPSSALPPLPSSALPPLPSSALPPLPPSALPPEIESDRNETSTEELFPVISENEKTSTTSKSRMSSYNQNPSGGTFSRMSSYNQNPPVTRSRASSYSQKQSGGSISRVSMYHQNPSVGSISRNSNMYQSDRRRSRYKVPEPTEPKQRQSKYQQLAKKDVSSSAFIPFPLHVLNQHSMIDSREVEGEVEKNLKNALSSNKEEEDSVTLLENQKEKYLSRLKPILQENQTRLETLISDYIKKITKVITEEKIEESLKKELIEEEEKRITSETERIFKMEENSTANLLEKETATRRRAFKIKQNIVKIQAIARGWLTRKKTVPLLKRERYRNRLVQEIVSTERTYAKLLNIMITEFYDPLQSKTFMKPEDVSSLFSNCKLILNVSKTLLEELETKMKNWNSRELIGEIFIKLVPWFKLYTEYVNNYDKAIRVFTKYLKVPDFMNFITQKSLQTELKGLSLESLLILPIQRIPRYEMLLKDLVKFTAQDHPDYSTLVEAASELQKVTNYMNENKRKTENINKVVQIQESLEGFKNLVQPFRVFIYEGLVLREKQRQSLDYSCYLFLFNDALLITQRRKGILEDRDYFNYQDFIPLSKILTISPVESTRMLKYGFSVSLSGGAQERFFTETMIEKNNWMYHILDQVEKIRDAKKSLKLLDDQKKRSETLGIDSPVPMASVPMRRSQTTIEDSPSKDLIITDPSSKAEDEVKLASRNAHRNSNPNPNSNNFTDSVTSTSKASKLVELFNEANKLYMELFQNPNELKKLLPNYEPNTAISDYHARIQKLRNTLKSLGEMEAEVKCTLQKEYVCAVFDKLISKGFKPIGEIKEFIATLPSNTPLLPKVNQIIQDLSQFYQDLSEAWIAIQAKE